MAQTPEIESKKPFKSTVLGLINYEFLDAPPWRENGKEGSANEMISQIIDLQETWSTLKINTAAEQIKEIQERYRKIYCDINTDPLTDHLNESAWMQKKQDFENVMNALSFLEKEGSRGTDDQNNGLLTSWLLQELHKIFLQRKGEEIIDGYTKHGDFSNLPRYTTHPSFPGKYDYPVPEDMEKTVILILDRFNSLLTDASSESDKRERLNGIFKSLAWFLFEILDLHPFGNGNGRVFRACIYYVLYSCGETVVPCPLYHACDAKVDGHSTCYKPCKDDYLVALVNTRLRDHRVPRELATMLVESCWKTWDKFIKCVSNSELNITGIVLPSDL